MIKSVVITFRTPARRLVMSSPLCDKYGSVVDLNINGIHYYCNESPMMVQPDLLVDAASKQIVGFTFKLTSPAWMNDRCRDMLLGLDPNAIRISSLEPELVDTDEGYIGLEVIWGKANFNERMLAQLDFGLWAFLYSTPNPCLFRQGRTWTPPEGLVIGDLNQLGYPVSLENGESGDSIVETDSLNSD
jgi:hypothetical protein